MTVTQLAHVAELRIDSCSAAMRELSRVNVVTCLNPVSRRSRVYFLTKLGKSLQDITRIRHGLSPLPDEVPDLEWSLFGWICFTHREAVIKALIRPMQPSEIKRVARFQNQEVRMSANNVRDVIRLFLERGIVQKVYVRNKTHPRYELTELGKKLQALMLQSKARK